jgi:hypothetical protein
MGLSQIYVVDADNNNLIGLKSRTDVDPYVSSCQTLDAAGDLTFESAGITLDDFGRIYVANQRACKIQIFDYEMRSQFPSFGKNGIDGPGQFHYPRGIIVDTYYEQAEAIILEGYSRFSGIQSYLINGAASVTKPSLGFTAAPMPKRSMTTDAPVASEFQLGEAYPNPFNSTCMISFSTNSAAHVRIDIYNLLGQIVATPFDKDVAAGAQSVKFSADNLSSGVYFYKVTSEGVSMAKKIVLLK